MRLGLAATLRLIDRPVFARLGAVQAIAALATASLGVLKAIGVVALGDPIALVLIAIGVAIVLTGLRRRPREPDLGVLGDIDHRDGCPRDPARMETWTQTRERDGIEYTVGKCNDCGAMAYRHGDRPALPPLPGGNPSRDDAPPDPSPAERLNKALSEGIKLRTRVLLRPDEKPPFDEDQLFQWARSTYDLLVADYSGYADEFFGEDSSLGPAHFGTSFAFGLDRYGRDGYLEHGIALLTRIAREPLK